MNLFDVKDHEPSLLPDGDWELVWHDEFDGETLDRTKWDYRTSMMNRVHPAWTTEGVSLDGRGNAVFSVLPDENGRPTSSQLQTGYNFMDEPITETVFGEDHLQWNIGKLKTSKFLHRYGYYECRCRLQQMPGWWSAFWIQSPIIGASLDPAESGAQIDIMNCYRPGCVHPHKLFTGGYGLDMKHKQIGGIDVDGQAFHRFGMLWDETGYTFYVDGKEDGKFTDYISHRPEFILITTEINGYRDKTPAPSPEAYAAMKAGDTFLVDYVRVFDRKES